MGRFQPGDLIQYSNWSSGAPPVIRVQEQVEGHYILINPDNHKFLRPVHIVDQVFHEVPKFSDEELLG